MAKLSPVQQMRADHKTKAELADKVLALLEQPADEDREVFERRIRTMSNTKLMRLWNAYQTLSAKYGTREELINKIVLAQFPSDHAGYRTKVSGYTVPRLLDLARQVKV